MYLSKFLKIVITSRILFIGCMPYNGEKASKNIEVYITTSYLNLDTTNGYELPPGLTLCLRYRNKSSQPFLVKSKYKFNHPTDSTILDHLIMISSDTIRYLYVFKAGYITIPNDTSFNLVYYVFMRDEYKNLVRNYDLKKHYNTIENYYKNLLSYSKFYYIRAHNQQYDTIEIKKAAPFKLINGSIDLTNR